MKIIMHNKEGRDMIMRNLHRLKDAALPYKDFSVGYDLTATEREHFKQKVEEASTKNQEQQAYFWKVRGPPWALRLRRENRRNDINVELRPQGEPQGIQ
jgi:hypothetical protein